MSTPNLRLSWDERGDPATHAGEDRVLDRAGQAQDSAPGVGDHLSDRVEEQETEPLRPGGPEISVMGVLPS